MTEIRPGLVWLTIDRAAGRVQRSPVTIRRWARQGLITIRLGLIDEHQLLDAQRHVAAAARARGQRSLQARAEVHTLSTTIGPPRPHDGGDTMAAPKPKKPKRPC